VARLPLTNLVHYTGKGYKKCKDWSGAGDSWIVSLSAAYKFSRNTVKTNMHVLVDQSSVFRHPTKEKSDYSDNISNPLGDLIFNIHCNGLKE